MYPQDKTSSVVTPPSTTVVPIKLSWYLAVLEIVITSLYIAASVIVEPDVIETRAQVSIEFPSSSVSNVNL